MTTKLWQISSAIALAALLGACGDDDSTPTVDSGMTVIDSGMTTVDGGGNTPPTLGAQLDRMGRPAVNTALTGPFLPTAMHDAKQDAYNTAKDPTAWSAAFKVDITFNLGVLDALDTSAAADGCGNQLAATMATPRYSFLAGVLADDQLYVDTSGTTVTQYLAVEAKVLGIANTDCGGRGPLYDVADTTYSVLATGGLTGVTDGVAADDKTASNTVFPFLADPN